MRNTRRVVKKTDYNTKITVIKNKILSVTGLAKTASNTKATQIDNKRPDITGFTTTPGFNRLKKIIFDAKMKEAVKYLPSKSQVDNDVDVGDENRKHLKKSLNV